MNPRLAVLAASLVTVVLAVVTAPAGAQDAAFGGAQAPGRPSVSDASCATQKAWTCARGQVLTLTGEELAGAGTIVFLGGPGPGDDVRVPLGAHSAGTGELLVVVPRRARTGPLLLVSAMGASAQSPRALNVVRRVPGIDDASTTREFLAGGRRTIELRYTLTGEPASDARVEAVRVGGGVVRSWRLSAAGSVRWDGFTGDEPAPTGTYVLRLNAAARSVATEVAGTDGAVHLIEGLFPIRGPHTPPQSDMQRFGGPRGHQGTDHFSPCGTPLAALTKGVVNTAGFQSAAGNYVVVDMPSGESYAYMHLRDPALVSKGDTVFAGQRLGNVGRTGDASGCHLHIELWSAPGYYRGGSPFDSLPLMQRLDRFS
jgi:murein DD-endopeptidase MepM/ murein hydrolase activator NlpD